MPTLRSPSSFRTTPLLFLGAVVLFATPLEAWGQSSAVVDEGTFMVTRKGAPIGRESFRIKREPAPGGQVYRAQGESSLGGDRISSSLGTDSAGVPVSYESSLRQNGQLVQRIQGRGRPGRFSVLAQTKSGESAREYVLHDGALLIDEDVFHHSYFVPFAAQHADLTIIAPRSAQQARVRLEEQGPEDVEIAGRSIPGRRFAVIGANGVRREVWIDEKGRLLKVSIPEKGLVALRDDPPR
jgi:hypothetical protein